MITYKENALLTKKELLPLYESVGWSNYTIDSAQLERAIKQSYCVLSAWDHQYLVGLIRVISDGETILYIQDILVHPDYQKKGIGSHLMESILEKFTAIRQKTLLTDNTEKTRAFYEKLGFKACENGAPILSFYREF